MFAPNKTWRRWHRKINLKQKRYAVVSAIAATALPALVMARGHRIEEVPEVPLVIDDGAGAVGAGGWGGGAGAGKKTYKGNECCWPQAAARLQWGPGEGERDSGVGSAELGGRGVRNSGQCDEQSASVVMTSGAAEQRHVGPEKFHAAVCRAAAASGCCAWRQRSASASHWRAESSAAQPRQGGCPATERRRRYVSAAEDPAAGSSSAAARWSCSTVGGTLEQQALCCGGTAASDLQQWAHSAGGSLGPWLGAVVEGASRPAPERGRETQLQLWATHSQLLPITHPPSRASMRSRGPQMNMQHNCSTNATLLPGICRGHRQDQEGCGGAEEDWRLR